MADLSISQVREKFPQYNDLSDEQLAQGLHKKYYSDMPFDTFSQKIGLKSKPVDQMPMYDPMGGVTGYTEAKAPISKETREFERREGPFGYAKEYGKGAIAGAVGLPGELINLPGTVAGMAGVQVPRAPIGVSETSETMFGKPTSNVAAGMRTAGEVLGIPTAPGFLTKAARIPSKILPEVETSTFVLRPGKELEKVMAPATSVSAVGEKLETKLSNRLENLIKTRREEFEKVKDAYFAAGRAKEDKVLNEYQNAIISYYSRNSDRLSPDEISLLQKSLARLKERPVSLTGDAKEFVRPGFDAIEKERRFLDDVANGLKVEGAEAIPATFAREMSKELEKVISNNLPQEFNAFNKTYTELSAPINRYNTALGQAVTKKAGEYLPEISKIDPAKIPGKFFDSRRSINELRALAGDEAFVQKVAREHIATDLRNLKEAKQVRDYISKNYDWLQELPQIRQELEGLATATGRGEFAKKLAAWGAAGAIGSSVLGKATKLFGD